MFKLMLIQMRDTKKGLHHFFKSLWLPSNCQGQLRPFKAYQSSCRHGLYLTYCSCPLFPVQRTSKDCSSEPCALAATLLKAYVLSPRKLLLLNSIFVVVDSEIMAVKLFYYSPHGNYSLVPFI